MAIDEFRKNLFRRIAQISVGASALRNQGGSGLVNECRNYFEHYIDIGKFFDCLSQESLFKDFLDMHTEALVIRFAEGAQNWGAARKGINLFFRDIVYNRFVPDYFTLPTATEEFNRLIEVLEVPLDRDVALGLKGDSKIQLPKWEGIKHLDTEISRAYQDEAKVIAENVGLPRVHLDLRYYRKEKEKKGL